MENFYPCVNCSDVISEQYPALLPEFRLAFKIIVGTTCVLSILGASLIVLTYVAYRDLRTTARQLLVNLSIADIVISMSHFVGLFANFDRFVSIYGAGLNISDTPSDALCTAQGAFTMYGTIASILWTVAIAFYMLVIIILLRTYGTKKLVPIFYLVCWGLPAALTICFVAANYLGYDEEAFGWCYGRLTASKSTNLVIKIVGYHLWLYAAFIIVPLIYVAIFCYLRSRVSSSSSSSMHTLHTLSSAPDLKLLFVPLLFLFLRIWGVVVESLMFYVSDNSQMRFRMSWASAILLLLSAVGNSAQGVANAILFCVCTRHVRRNIRRTLERLLPCQWWRRRSDWLQLSSTTAFEETTVLDEDSRRFPSTNTTSGSQRTNKRKDVGAANALLNYRSEQGPNNHSYKATAAVLLGSGSVDQKT